MSEKDPNKIAAIEKAISDKYGDDAIQNPKANWSEDKEREYVEDSKAFYKKLDRNDETKEKIDINGIMVSKKLLNRESLRSCCVCSALPRKTMDDVCLSKFESCNDCYIQYIEGREERWLDGWRP
tara:strand:+ start:1805 stop:2179 length:375 start_codon:yes stop_codon:yes gene_type:complete